VPVLVGWSAVTGTLSWAPVVLFAVIFIWTPPHFWALAIRYRDDYREAGIPMLPAVATIERTAVEILVYTVALVVTTLVFTPVAHMGVLYTASAAVLGALVLVAALRLYRDLTPRAAIALFRYSITYLTLLFIAMAADVLVRLH
jgi:protoheme IX farnesyltransferase